MRKLTLRDYKILSELDKDPDISFNKIGKKLRLSPSVIERRTKNLIKEGVIRSFLGIINYKKLGYTYYSIYSRFHNIDDTKRNQILNYLKEHPLSGQILQCDGRWQLIYGFFAKDIFDLNEELRKFNNLFGNYLGETEKIIHIGSHHYFRGYLLNKNLIRKDEPFLGGPEDIIDLDRTSIKLLNNIRYNPRINYVELTKNLNLSLDRIRYRIKKLKKDNIFLGPWLHINPEKLDLHFYRILLKLKNLNKINGGKILYFLNENKNIVRANHIYGSWDFLIDLEISTEDFRIFIDEFTKKFSDFILEYETLMVHDEVKFTFSPLF
jgi:DNA-binding Lrp family transcriptional regulator